jgi:hypothetical protein
MSKVFALRTMTWPTVAAGDVRVTPESRLLQVRLPFGGFAWHRPSAVVVEHNGRVERRRVVDITRLAQLAFLAWVVAVWLVTQRWLIQRRENAA